MREPEHRFLHYLCETYQKLPDDPFFEEMDPLLKLYMYESWIAKQELEMERTRHASILTGSFSNPEAARKMVEEEPDHASTDEEFEKSFEMAMQISDEPEKPKHRRGRKVIRGE